MTFPAFGGMPQYGEPDGSEYREEIMLQTPPLMPKAAAGGQQAQQLLYMLLPMLGMGSMSFLYIGRGGSGPLTWVILGVSVIGMIGMVVMSLVRGSSQKKVQINDERRDYLRYLGNMRKQVREVAKKQAEEMRDRLPDPNDLWMVAGTGRMWRRRRADESFAQVRVATGVQLLSTPLRVPETAPLEDLDPVASTSLRLFIRAYGTVPDVPVAVSLRSFSRVTIGGERPEVLGLTRALLAQLATFHSPAGLRIAVCPSRRNLTDWEWLKWLPHATDPVKTDPAGPVRLCGASLAELAALLGDDLGQRSPFIRGEAPADSEQPHVVVILDGGKADPHPALDPVDGRDGVTFIDIGGWPAAPTATTLQLLLDGGLLGRRTPEGLTNVGRPDHLDAAAAEFVARQMTAIYTVGAPTAADADEPVLTSTFGLTDLLGVGDPRRVDPTVTWRPRPARDRLRIAIGVDPGGRPVDLDLKESAEGGMGPHGLVIGATGSGKSELLRTLVTGLAVTHSSETLNFALVDFKGGATFAGMANMPHVCAVITNLSDELSLVDRMADALRGEMMRRQELLRATTRRRATRARH
jgi:ESX secretion system protein EccC